EVCASVGKAWLFADRLLAYQRLIPRKIIEGAPAIENDELAPPVGNPRGAVEVLFAPRGIDVAALHWAGVKDTDLENVSLRRLDRRARLRGVWHRRETGPQFGKHGAAFAQIGLLHAALFHHIEVVAAIDDGDCLLASRRVRNAALLELVSEHKPEGGVILIAGIVGGAALAIAQDINDAVFIERQTQR